MTDLVTTIIITLIGGPLIVGGLFASVGLARRRADRVARQERAA